MLIVKTTISHTVIVYTIYRVSPPNNLHPMKTTRVVNAVSLSCGMSKKDAAHCNILWIAEQTVELELSYVLFHMLSRKLDVSWIRHAPKYLCDIYFPKNRKINSAAEIKWCPISHAIAQIRCVLNFTCAQISLWQILSDFSDSWFCTSTKQHYTRVPPRVPPTDCGATSWHNGLLQTLHIVDHMKCACKLKCTRWCKF